MHSTTLGLALLLTGLTLSTTAHAETTKVAAIAADASLRSLAASGPAIEIKLSIDSTANLLCQPLQDGGVRYFLAWRAGQTGSGLTVACQNTLVTLWCPAGSLADIENSPDFKVKNFPDKPGWLGKVETSNTTIPLNGYCFDPIEK